MHRIERIALPVAAPGSERSLIVHRFGDSRPKAYFHAGLHADEWPGLLVLQHLLARLRQADSAGQLQGEVIVVPVANPIGLGQTLNHHLVGRYDFAGSGNFNRNFPELDERLLEWLDNRLGDDAKRNADLIRIGLRQALTELEPRGEAMVLKTILLGLSLEADYVFDLHCDNESLLHIYAPQAQQEFAAELGAQLGAFAVLLEEDSGGGAFDQVNSSPWFTLRERLGNPAIPLGSFATTVELRGKADVGDAYAQTDAENLFRFLQRRGVIAGDPGTLPKSKCQPTSLQGTDVIRAGNTGVVNYRKALGDQVEAGETIADLVVLEALVEINYRLPIVTSASGVFFACASDKLVRPGQSIGKVAGNKPLPNRRMGALLED